MIVGLGTDIVDIRRIARALERHGERFSQRIARAEELDGRTERLAAVFAAKEACVKALGTGFTGGIGFKDLRVIPGGAPRIELDGAAAQRAKNLGVRRIQLSLAHERDYAVATVILEA
ncbi:MAG: Holo-(acyl-carrier-protein) synthase [Deltaproteobacteria bacterium ADurb.Bin510]|nr:MAG: Holo-(acyl-carrier-protein) synthase [Deltaproteobacteria bacterium ADurb.Bin510]